jgi:aryl-alcohol dehydrogenase-like predicted oxidoreductase
VLQELADARGATPRQVALAFLVRRPSLFAIPKAGDLRHVEENAAAGDLVLTPQEIARVEQAFPLGKKPRSLPTI